MNTQILDPVLLQTDFPGLHLFASGKVRDVYRLDSDRLLFVATDRISAFDYVLATGIPHKGRVLTQISLFWFDFLKDIVPNHFVTADVNRYPAAMRDHADELRGRSMMVMRAEMFSFEEMCKLVDPELSRQLRDITLRIYKKAADYARQRGILIADTKFEFGQT